MEIKTDFFSSLQIATEKFLTKRKKRMLKNKMKAQARNWLVDWLDAIIWAICMVVIVNQYVFQMYRIPSGSMSGTLEEGDMICVNKMIYGPELLPSLGKLPGLKDIYRGEVIVFVNPSYLSKGTVFTIAHQLIYLATFTLIDIDKDEMGQPKAHYLIKRAVATGGDTLHLDDGEISFKFRGTDRWISERDYQKQSGFTYPIRRMVQPEDYPQIEEAGKNSAFYEMGLSSKASVPSIAQYDSLEFEKAEMHEVAMAYPHDFRFVNNDRKIANGWFVALDRVMTMGDNRDNSLDARWFGAVSEKKVLGQALFIYWPLTHAKRIK